MEKLEWLGYPTVKKISKIPSFVFAQLTNVTDGHRVTAYTALIHMNRAVKTYLTTSFYRYCELYYCNCDSKWLFFVWNVSSELLHYIKLNSTWIYGRRWNTSLSASRLFIKIKYKTIRHILLVLIYLQFRLGRLWNQILAAVNLINLIVNFHPFVLYYCNAYRSEFAILFRVRYILVLYEVYFRQ